MTEHEIDLATALAKGLAEDVACPHCGHSLGIEVVSKAMSKSRMTFEVSPAPGELLNAATVGGSIEGIAKLLCAVGDEMGVKTQVLVENITFASGGMKVHLVVARHESGITQDAE